MERYEFMCANRECSCVKNRGMYFTTNNIDEAAEHSRENNSPIWIEKRE